VIDCRPEKIIKGLQQRIMLSDAEQRTNAAVTGRCLLLTADYYYYYYRPNPIFVASSSIYRVRLYMCTIHGLAGMSHQEYESVL